MNPADGPQHRSPERFPRRHRLRRPADFEHVYRQRVSVSDAFLIVYGYPNQLDRTRLGLSVSRKVGKAHVRNRWKRLIREAFRRQSPMPPGYDLIVIPRRQAEPSWPQVRESLPRLLQLLLRRLRRKRG